MDKLNELAAVSLQQMMRDPRTAAIDATIERQYATQNMAQGVINSGAIKTPPRRVRVGVTEVKNGWLAEWDGEQYVFQSEQELAAWLTAKRVQRALQEGG